MTDDLFSSEEIWEELLSEEPERIRTAYRNLVSDEERNAVYTHLQRMTSEEGYADVQRQSAQAALNSLAELR